MSSMKKNASLTSNDAQALAMKEALAASDISTEEFIALCRSRANMYNIMAGLCSKEVTAEKHAQLMESLYPISTDNDNINESSRLIAGYLSRKSEGVTEELAADYSATFIGRGSNGHSAAYPFESTYTAPKRLLMQGARDEVLAIYRSQGLDKCETWKNSEDHISVELEFMERMCKRCANALEKDNKDAAATLLCVQHNFLTGHLHAWVPMFCSEMRRFAQTDFYLGLSYMVLGYIESDVAFFDELLSGGEAAGGAAAGEDAAGEGAAGEGAAACEGASEEAAGAQEAGAQEESSDSFTLSYGFNDDSED